MKVTGQIDTFQRVTHYSVSALPEGYCVDSYAWELTVEYRGDERWAVKRHSMCLSRQGVWDYEMQPSSREDEWLDNHRFTEEEALALAHEHAPNVCVNNTRPADLLAKYGPEGQDWR